MAFEAGNNLTTSITSASIPSISISQLLPGAQDHETVSANLFRTLTSAKQEGDIKDSLRPGALAALLRDRSMQGIKEACGVEDSLRQSDFHSMREKGMFFCGYQDAAMKKQGLPSVYTDEAEMIEISSSEEEETYEDPGSKAVESPEEDRRIILQRVKGGTVSRRLPQSYEAVYDFGESRISVPRQLKLGATKTFEPMVMDLLFSAPLPHPQKAVGF